MAPVHEVALEVQLAQGLAGNEADDRDRTFETLRKFIRLQLPHLEEPLTQDDFIKIWKGIHYRLWMQDKPLIQEKLINEICGLLFHFPTEEYAMMYIKTFFETENREWSGIDQHRLDKFMMLIREFINATFMFLSKSDWKLDLINQLNVIMEESVFNPGKAMQPISLQLHIIELYPLELRKVVNEQLTPETATYLFAIFVNIFPLVNNPIVVASILSLLHTVFFEGESSEEKKKKKHLILDGVEERDATEFENPVKLTVNREKFLTLLMETASSEKGLSKRRKQLYNLIRRIKDLEYRKPSSKIVKKSKKKRKNDRIKQVDIEEAAVRYLEFNEELRTKIPSQKESKKLERLLYKKSKLGQKTHNGEQEDGNNVMEEEEEKDEDSVIEEEEEDEDSMIEEEEDDGESEEGEDGAQMASDFIHLEAGNSEDDDEDEDYDFDYDFYAEEEAMCDEDDYDMCDGDEEEEEEYGSGGDAEVDQLVDSSEIEAVYINGEPDDDYDDEDEEYGSDDGLEFDVEEAFLNMDEEEEETEEGGSSIEGSDGGADGVGCYIVDVQTDNNNSSSGSDTVQNLLQELKLKSMAGPTCKKLKLISPAGPKCKELKLKSPAGPTCKELKLKSPAGPTCKSKKDSGSSDGKSETGKPKRKNVELSDDEDMVGKKMRMMMEIMASNKVTPKKKKKKRKKKQTKAVDCDTPSIGDSPSQTTPSFLNVVDSERGGDENGEEVCGLVEQKVKKKKKKKKLNEEETMTDIKDKTNQNQKQENVDSNQMFPLPTGLDVSPDLRGVYNQLKTTINTEQMRQTPVADKKIKRKLNRYFDMVAKSKLLNEEEVPSSVVIDNEDTDKLKAPAAVCNDNEDKNNENGNNFNKISKTKAKRMKRAKAAAAAKQSPMTVNLKPFFDSPPTFFQNAISKLKMSGKRKKSKPKVSSAEELNDISLQDRKSVSFDMKQNKAFLPETPISAETPFNSQKKPKTGILKPSPSPILVVQKKKKKKNKVVKRQKAADFF